MELTYDEMALGPDAYSSRPSRGTLEYTRVYRAYGRHAHLRESGCRYLTARSLMYGTGSQSEYEEAAGLPLCRACFAWREQYRDDPRLGTGHGCAMA